MVYAKAFEVGANAASSAVKSMTDSESKKAQYVSSSVAKMTDATTRVAREAVRQLTAADVKLVSRDTSSLLRFL
jgi:hypothetical protein